MEAHQGEGGRKLVVILSSNDASKAVMALLTAAVSAGMGNETYLIVTLHGIDAIVKDRASKLRVEKSFVGSMLRKRGAEAGIPESVEALYRLARANGVKVYVDQVSLKISGLRGDDLLEFDELVGPGTIAEMAARYGSITF